MKKVIILSCLFFSGCAPHLYEASFLVVLGNDVEVIGDGHLSSHCILEKKIPNEYKINTEQYLLNLKTNALQVGIKGKHKNNEEVVIKTNDLIRNDYHLTGISSDFKHIIPSTESEKIVTLQVYDSKGTILGTNELKLVRVVCKAITMDTI